MVTALGMVAQALAGLQFDGVSQYVTFGSATNLGSSTFTLEVWFNWRGGGATASTGAGGVTAVPLLAKLRGEFDGDNRDGNYFLGIRPTDGVLVADFEEGATGSSPGLNHPVFGATAVTSGLWHHAAVTYDGAAWQVYLDGRQEATQAVGQPPRWDSIQHAALGSALDSSGTPQGYFPGVLSEARIWNYARTALQISTSMAVPIPSAPGLLGRWALDEVSGTVAHDSSGHGADGTLVNGPVWTNGPAFGTAVVISSPTNNLLLAAPANVPLVATVPGPEPVTNVAFFAGTALLGQLTNSPYTLLWSNVPPGAYTLTAVAVDNVGSRSTSSPVSLSVVAALASQWTAYNDHNRGSGTAPNVSTYSLSTAGINVGGPLTNFDTGQLLSPDQLGVVIAAAGTISGNSGASTAPDPGTPADQLFTGKMDWAGSSLYFGSGAAASSSEVQITFTNLTAGRHYGFRGTAVRGATYTGRWTIATLAGASSATPAHSQGSGSPGIITNGWAPYGSMLAPGTQAAWNCGINLCGDVVGWDDIVPVGNSFSVICSNYLAVASTGPSGPLENTYCYALNAFRLEEFAAGGPLVQITTPKNNALVVLPTNVVVSAVASGFGGPVTNVAFYGGTTKLADAPHSPFSFAWANLTPGTYTLRAVAMDNTGLSVTSAAVVFRAQNNVAPTVAILNPTDSATYSAPVDIAIGVTASDSDGAVTNLDLLANGTLLNRVGAAPMSFLWPSVGVGNHSLVAIATDDHGAQATSSVVRVYVVASTAPTVEAFGPGTGRVLSNLTALTVTFTQPVDGVDAADLLVNGVPATAVTGSNAVYTFTFAAPAEELVVVAWAPAHGIHNRLTPAQPFDGTLANEEAQFTLTDTIPPAVVAVSPAGGATLSALTQFSVTFSEPVAGVVPGSLRVNGLPAGNVSGALAGPYLFTFAQPANGPVQLTLDATGGIHDLALARNPYAGGTWNDALDTNLLASAVIINEVYYHPPSENPAEEWLELYNPGAVALNLMGWHFTKGLDFVFPAVTLPAGGYLVVAADLVTFGRKHPDVTNVVGGWSGDLGTHLVLADAAGRVLNDVPYRKGGDWGERLRGAGEQRPLSVTRSGTTATVIWNGYLNNGDTVVITGADQAEYNGTFTVSGCTYSSFNYPLSGTPVSPATSTNAGAIVVRLMTSWGRQGWAWSSHADGLGSSLELINARLPNQYGQNWRAANTNGTPGRANFVANNNIAPLILHVRHFPLLPRSTNAITITATLLDEHPTGVSAVLFWRLDSLAGGLGFSALDMFDDGAHGDGLAGDGVFGAILPPQTNNAVVEFYVQARDAEGNLRTWPSPALSQTRQPLQQANALLQVDNNPANDYNPATGLPVYRLVMLASDTNSYLAFPGTAPESDAAMNTTFLALDGTSAECLYLCDVRDRGAGTRSRQPANHRLTFPDDQPWHGVGSLELNSQYTHAQLAGYALSAQAGLNAEWGRVVRLRINNNDRASSAAPQYGVYIQLQPTDRTYAKTHFPDDPDGNLYRGQGAGLYGSALHVCNLAYLGTNWTSYANLGYSQQSGNGDWSDLATLCAVLNTNTPDPAVYATAVRRVIDVDEWMRAFATFTLLLSRETSLPATSCGDDYTLYRGTKDPRFLLLAHDWDTILNEGDTTGGFTDSLFRFVPAIIGATNANPGPNVLALNRLFTHPDFVPAYYRELQRQATTLFTAGRLGQTLSMVLSNFVPQTTINNMTAFGVNRANYVLSQIPTNLTVSSSLTTSAGFYYTTVPSALLYGRADVVKSRQVTVNGSLSTWSAWNGFWTNTVPLQPGVNRLLVQSLDSNGVAFAQTNVEVWYDRGATTPVGGTLTADTVWAAASGPYNVASTLTVPSGITLTIQPGSTVYLGAGVNITVANGGRILAEGTATLPIRFTVVPGSGVSWGGLTINGSVGSPETRLAHIYFQGNAGVPGGEGNTCLEVAGGTLSLDHATFLTPTCQYVSLDRSSFLITGCTFPTTTAAFELVHGTGGIKAGGRGIVRECFFGGTSGYNDIMDFTGGNRDENQPIIQYYHNVFVGGSDDMLDLDGTDAWIEGNIFLHCHRQTGTPDSSSAVSGGNYDFGGTEGVRTSEITMVGNLFFDCDNAATAKEGNFFTFLNNTIVHQNHSAGIDYDGGVVNVRDIANNGTGTPTALGKGFYLEGNIIFDIEKLVRNYDPANTPVVFNNNILPLAWTGPGSNNTVVVPQFKHLPTVLETSNFTSWAQAQVMWDWLSLLPSSPGVGAGPNGRDQGGVIPYGVSVSGAPQGVVVSNSARLAVGTLLTGYNIPSVGFPQGSGFTAYQYQLDGGAWSGERLTAVPITVTNQANGLHRLYVVGKNDAGYYQNDAALGPEGVVTATAAWFVNTNAPGLRLNEVLARNETAVAVNGKHPDLVELYNAGPTAFDLAGVGLSDAPRNPRQFVFPPGATLGPGQYLVFYGDNETVPAGYHFGFGLNQEGASVYLVAATGAVLDSVTFGPQVPDLSLGRLPDGAWGLTHPTFGAANVAAQTADPHQLRLNEWLASAGDVYGSDFLELYNPDPLPVSLGGLSLTDTPIGRPSASPLPPLSFIAGSGYLVLQPDGNPGAGPTHLSFKLSADRGEIALFDASLALIDYVLYGPQRTDISQGRVPNGGTNLAFLAIATPGSPNSAPAAPNGTRLVLNEVLARNLAGLTNLDGRTPAWIELFNPTASAILLADLSLSDEVAAPRKFVFPAGVSVPVGGFLVVLCDGANPASTNGVAQPNTGFGIQADGGAIYLYDKLANGGSLLDAISYGMQVNDFSIGRFPNGGTNWVLTLPTPASPNLAVSTGDRAQVRINEWMASNPNGSDWFELFNPNSQPVNLSGLYLTDDLSSPATRLKFQIAPLSFLGTGLYGYAQFLADKTPAAGPAHVNFKLKAEGGSLGLSAPGDVMIDSVTFAAQTSGVSEGRLPDGTPNIVAFPTTSTPAEANFLPLTNVLVNEVLSGPAAGVPEEQAIELFNPSAAPADLSGWFLSNQKHALKKYQFPPGTVLPAGGYLVVYADQLTGNSDLQFNVWLDPVNGDQVYVSAADTNANLTGYRAEASFGAAEGGVSFGRYVNSVGNADFPALSRTTFGHDSAQSLADFRLGTGAPNADPKVGPVVVSEIMYHPTDLAGLDNTRDEYLELFNPGTNSVPLYDPAHPTNTWRLRNAVAFAFPTNVSLAAHGSLLVVSFDPVNDPTSRAAFLAQYPVASNAPMVGPYLGKLANSDAKVELYKPGAPTNGLVPYVLVERVHYFDTYPWPTGADGLGASLNRLSATGYGNDPTNWAEGPPSPGGLSLPRILTQPASQTAAAGGTVSLMVATWSIPPLSYQWRFNGTALTGQTQSTLILTNVQAAQAGAYTVLLSNPQGSLLSASALLTVTAGLVDSDGDGIPDAWMQQYFGHPTGLASDHSLAGQDADGDGLTNLEEYLAGTDPRDPGSSLKLRTLGFRPGLGYVLQFEAMSNRTYSVLFRPAFGGTNLWQKLFNVPPQPTTGPLDVLDTTAATVPDRFYRIVTPAQP